MSHMPVASAEQQRRRLAIGQLLRSHAIHRQSELVALLRAEGFAATQSSVSRDLKMLGAAKLENGYSLPEPEVRDNGHDLQIVAELVRNVRPAGPYLIVITTAVGAAQRVAVTLDRTAWPEIVGTVSGDDTIFVATVNAAQQRRLSARLREHFGKLTT
jgi:transcriptional regulator of arginine metabolism